MQWCILCSDVIIIYHHHSGDHSIICSNLSSSQPGASKHFYQLTDTPSRFSLSVLYSKFCIEVGLLLLTNYHYCHDAAAVVVFVRIICNRTEAKSHSSNQKLPLISSGQSTSCSNLVDVTVMCVHHVQTIYSKLVEF